MPLVSLRIFTRHCFVLYFCWLLPAAATASSNIDELLTERRFDAAVAAAGPNHYLRELVQQAAQARLWKDPVWQRLLHYKPTLTGDMESQVDGTDFFLSGAGKRDPRAELRATLAAFFSNADLPPNGFTAQCRFRARYFWLEKKLRFDPARLPAQDCPKFDFFMQGVRPDGITVVFPAEHPDSPSSMFGHTLIRLDRAGQSEATRMLDYTINFAAEAGDSGGVGYAIKGLTGNFEGRFRIIPYYMKLREYAQMENRDIWEYRLKLSPEQTRFVAMHAWEMVPTYFDYYFFTENCAYHLLSILEPALPEYDLTDAFDSWVLPVNILRVLRANGLIADVRYFPSRYRVIQTRRARLSADDEALALDLFAKGLKATSDRLRRRDPSHQADILDLAYEYRRYAKVATDDVLDPALSDDERELLLIRSRLGIQRPAPEVPSPATSPDGGHRSTRAGLGYGAGDAGRFLQLDWRAVYHDWLDPVSGHSTSYALAFGDLALRYYPDSANADWREQLRLRRLHLVRIDNMEPWDGFFRRVSWRVVTGFESITRDDRRRAYVLRGGPGISIGTRDKRLLGYALLEAELAAAGSYDLFRAAAGPAVGMMASLGSRWRLEIDASYLADRERARRDRAELKAGLAWHTDTDSSLRLLATRQHRLDGWGNEVTLSAKLYF